MKNLLLLFACVCLFGVSCSSQASVKNDPHATTPSDLKNLERATVNPLANGGATIEIVSPKSNQIIAPGSTIEVETLTRLNGGQLKDVYIAGDGIPFDEDQGRVRRMELVSKEGNLYRHRYMLENAPAKSVYSGLQVSVVDDNGDVSEDEVGYLVKEIPKVTITSPKDGQSFEKATKIVITFDAPNRGRDDEYKIYIDGKDHARTVMGGGRFYWIDSTAGTHTIQIVVTFDDIELARSAPVTVYVK